MAICTNVATGSPRTGGLRQCLHRRHVIHAVMQVLPAVADILAPACQLIMLIKPQFEASRLQVRRASD